MRNSILSTGNEEYTKEKSNSKKIILIFIIILITIILLGGAIFAYIYFFTDSLLSENQMFYKYIAKNSEIIEMLSDKDLDKYLEKLKTDSYSNNEEFTIAFSGDILNDEETKKVVDEIQKHKITLKGSVDEKNKYTYQELKLIYDNTDIISGDLINKDDYYGLKVNDIGLNRFIVLENNNLKQFARNLGLQDQQIEFIPNKIDLENINIKELFTEEELENLKEKYLKVITDSLTEDMFSKKEENEMQVYTLTINEEKETSIINSLIDTLKNDDILLNKIKQIIIQQGNKTEDEAQALIDQLKASMEDSNEDYKANEYGNTQQDNMYISVYVSKRNLVKTEIFIKDEVKIIITNNENNVAIEVAEPQGILSNVDIVNSESQNQDVTYKTTSNISITKNKTNNELSYIIDVFEEDNKEILKTTLKFTGLSKIEDVKTEILMNIYVSNLNNGLINLSQQQAQLNENAVEKENISIALSNLIMKVQEDTYISESEFVINETTIKEYMDKENLDITVSINEDGTYRLQSNTTGNIYTVNSQGTIINTESASNVQPTETEEKITTLSLNFNGTITFGDIQQQELTESNMYIINNKSLESLEAQFNILSDRVSSKFMEAYKNSILRSINSELKE